MTKSDIETAENIFSKTALEMILEVYGLGPSNFSDEENLKARGILIRWRNAKIGAGEPPWLTQSSANTE